MQVQTDQCLFIFLLVQGRPYVLKLQSTLSATSNIRFIYMLL